jgi:hypothetical protein
MVGSIALRAPLPHQLSRACSVTLDAEPNVATYRLYAELLKNMLLLSTGRGLAAATPLPKTSTPRTFAENSLPFDRFGELYARTTIPVELLMNLEFVTVPRPFV